MTAKILQSTSVPLTKGSHEPGRRRYSISRRKDLLVPTCEREALALSRRARRGKIDHPGESRKACLFFGNEARAGLQGTGRLPQDLRCGLLGGDEPCLSPSISFKV